MNLMNPFVHGSDWGDGPMGHGDGTGGYSHNEFSPDEWVNSNVYDDGNGYGDSKDGLHGNGYIPGAPDDLACFIEHHDILQHSVMLVALLPLLRYPHASELRHARVAVHFPLDGT